MAWVVRVTAAVLVAPATLTEIESPAASHRPSDHAAVPPVKVVSSATVTPEVTAETVTTAEVGRKEAAETERR